MPAEINDGRRNWDCQWDLSASEEMELERIGFNDRLARKFDTVRYYVAVIAVKNVLHLSDNGPVRYMQATIRLGDPAKSTRLESFYFNHEFSSLDLEDEDRAKLGAFASNRAGYIKNSCALPFTDDSQIPPGPPEVAAVPYAELPPAPEPDSASLPVKEAAFAA